MWMIPMMTDIFILYEFKNVSLLLASPQICGVKVRMRRAAEPKQEDMAENQSLRNATSIPDQYQTDKGH